MFNTRNHSLLIVESDRVLLDSLCHRFVQLGFTVTAVHHPRMALEAATIKPFDLAIRSGDFPELSCSDLMLRLRRQIAHLQIIVLQNRFQGSVGDEEIRLDREVVESIGCLPRSCSLDRFEKSVRRAIGNRNPRSTSSRNIDAASQRALSV